VGQVKEFAVCYQNLSAKAFVEAAQLAEALGFGTFWVPEDYFYRGAFSLASAIASHTISLKVGIGVLNPYTRHPMLTAMEFAALDEIANGRAVLGLGASTPYWIEQQLAIPYTQPTHALRESVELLRQVFHGEPVNYRGQVFRTTEVRFNFRPTRTNIPIHLGVMGPRKLALAGEIADGVILGAAVSPAYVRFAVERIRRGAERVGRSLEHFSLAANLAISVADDAKAAREAAKPLVAGMIAIMGNFPAHPVFTCTGLLQEEVQRFVAAFSRGDFATAASMVTEEMIDTFAIAGSPEHCRKQLGRIIEAGVTVPVAFEIPGVSPATMLRDIQTHLMPYFL
jgi:5,10-methylenetetrahydromethanopterin reductase